MLCILFSMSITHIHTYRHNSPLGSFPFYQHTSPLLLVTTLLVLSLHIALTHIHTYRHSSPLVSFAPSLSTNTLHHCCYPPHIQRFPALPHHTAYILVSVFVGFSWMVFFHPEDGPCPKIWCIPFVSNIIYIFWKWSERMQRRDRSWRVWSEVPYNVYYYYYYYNCGIIKSIIWRLTEHSPPMANYGSRNSALSSELTELVKINSKDGICPGITASWCTLPRKAWTY